ncbi:MAG: NAD-dependent epimerase/dehydratase family protein [Vicinamibacterales bacterium]
MRKSVVLITGAGGEIGHALVRGLAETSSIVTLDVDPLDASRRAVVRREFIGSIIDSSLLDRILAEFEVDCVFHLAALLSTRSEFTPVTAHHVNVEGTLNLLEFAQKEGESHGRAGHVRLSVSIAAYGLPSLDDQGAGRPGARGSSSPSDDDVPVRTSCIAKSSDVTTRATTSSSSVDTIPTSRFPRRPVPRSHLGDDACRRAARPTTRPR